MSNFIRKIMKFPPSPKSNICEFLSYTFFRECTINSGSEDIKLIKSFFKSYGEQFDQNYLNSSKQQLRVYLERLLIINDIIQENLNFNNNRIINIYSPWHFRLKDDIYYVFLDLDNEYSQFKEIPIDSFEGGEIYEQQKSIIDLVETQYYVARKPQKKHFRNL